mmetsp:Transcript_65073/g.201445  ORF Transcript_65073/g.201445 Transcript_65073/m.201445 type:complete len:107 (-) Transcript_65073:96-416(-)
MLMNANRSPTYVLAVKPTLHGQVWADASVDKSIGEQVWLNVLGLIWAATSVDTHVEQVNVSATTKVGKHRSRATIMNLLIGPPKNVSIATSAAAGTTRMTKRRRGT